MPTNYTEHYQLNQWEADDKVLRADFNADNAKIDAALAALAGAVSEQKVSLETQETLLGKLGNCVVYIGSYTSNGSTQTVSFPHKPVFICVQRVGVDACIMIAVQGCTQAILHKSTSGETISLSWSGNSISWTGSQTLTFNGNSFRYLALLDAEH